MKLSIVLTTVNTAAFGQLVSCGAGGGILPPALASPPPLPRDAKHNKKPADDVGPPARLLGITRGGAAASTSDYLGSEAPKVEVCNTFFSRSYRCRFLNERSL